MISGQLKKSLTRLQELIVKSEDQLRKLPGSSKVELEVDEESYLEFDEKIKYVEEDGNKRRTLPELNIRLRTELAALIPEFIILASEAEKEVIVEIDNTSDKIEQALAQCEQAPQETRQTS
jgi:hypothetical protein